MKIKIQKMYASDCGVSWSVWEVKNKTTGEVLCKCEEEKNAELIAKLLREYKNETK